MLTTLGLIWAIGITVVVAFLVYSYRNAPVYPADYDEDEIDELLPESTLIIVDYQKDFYDKDGALYVPGAEKILPSILEAIHSGEYDKIILTMDWHKPNDKSFKENGGQWPIHCVQNTEGSEIHPAIIDAIIEEGIPYSFFFKGTDPNHEEYGAFEKEWSVRKGWRTNFEGQSFAMMSDEGVYDICGLAGDYCVWETYKILKDAALDVEPLYESMAFIGESFDYDERYNSENTTENEDVLTPIEG